VTPAFAFGHGLSYTTFEYSGLSFDVPTLTATFTIKNTGSAYGAEVAQLYLAFPAAAGEPPKVLRGFRKARVHARSFTTQLPVGIIIFYGRSTFQLVRIAS
jgi:beta-glucosidase